MTALTQSHSAATAGVGSRLFLAAALSLWFALVALAIDADLLRNPPGQPPLPLIVAVAIPLSIYFLLYRASSAFRNYVLSADLRLITILQSWRVAGVLFLGLYAYDVLPGLFALPAGIGDMAVGITAPVMALTLLARPGYAASRGFVLWNWLGIVDFIVAFTAGTLAAGVVPGLVGEVTSAPVTMWPLALIPAFLVPLFATLHITALIQARAARR
ncbi:MAG: hypothetical protein ACTSXZ_09570 [Alphaproteobacteria bacterium]